MTERVFTFGSHGGLVGILTEPAPDQLCPGAPAIIFSNIGLNHRVGPNRLYVELARSLAAAGFRSLRFDLSGFGDSEPRQDGGTDLQRATLDTREAMDFVERRGVRRFVLVGLCSGVDSVHSAALQDKRVAGAIFIEGYAYRNLGFWLRFLTTRNLQGARWKRFVRVRLARLTGQLPLRDLDDAPEIFVREYPARQQFSGDLATLSERGVKMLFVYTINSDNLYNYAQQFHDTFGYQGEIDVEFFTRADHVFSTEAQRSALLSRLTQWMGEQFQESPPMTATARRIASISSAWCLMGAAAMLSATRLARLLSEAHLLDA